MTTTIALVNQKGGVGKTTLATSLASAAHLAGHRTLILDLDAQGSALDWFAARGEGSPLADLAVAKVDRALTRPALATLTRGYDLAVLDAPPRLGELTRSAAVAADLVLIPVQPSPYDLWACSETLQTLDEADAIREQLGLGPARRVAVLNRVQSGTIIGREARAAVADVAVLLEVVIHQRVAFAVAAGAGESVQTTEPNGRAAAEVRALFEAVAPVAALRAVA